MKSLIIIAISALVILSACSKELTEYEKAIEKHRTEYNDYMKNDPNSPFNKKGKVEFSPLRYFEADTNFIFESMLNIYETQDTIEVYGTKGEPRKTIRFGYFNLNHQNETHRLNVYKSKYNDQDYYSIWFTDNTTNKQSYGVGRYLNLELNENSDFLYTIDFNYAYNPYCAYSKDYSCAMPTKEDNLKFAVLAGEQKFHD